MTAILKPFLAWELMRMHVALNLMDDPGSTQGQEATFLESVFAVRIPERCRPGHVIFWEGDTISDIVKIEDGVLRLYRLLPDGRRAITGFAWPNDILGLGFQDRCLYTAEAVTKVRLRRFPHQRLKVLTAERLYIHYEISHVVSMELEAAQKQMVLLGKRNAEERVASLLLAIGLRIAKLNRGRIAYDLPLTRLDMADYLGLTIETVCRAIAKLKNAGLVHLEGRHRVLLFNPYELARFARHDTLEDSEASTRRNTAPWPQ